MKTLVKLTVILILFTSNLWSQTLDDKVLSLEEYLGYVKEFHPVIKQNNLVLDESQAILMKSRGAFDPKLEVDFDRKEFNGSEYYNKLNGSFKIPTWYGIELKANYEQNSGVYLNPEATVPDDGLYSLGVSVSLAKGLLMNKRMATLKKAKIFQRQAEAEQKMLTNEILYDAIVAYFDWFKQYREFQVREKFLLNASLRFENVKRNFAAGDKPAIDTLEANISKNTRKLEYENARIKYLKSGLALSNFLWLKDNTPVELQEDMHPDLFSIESINSIIPSLSNFMDNDTAVADTLPEMNNHPKLVSLQAKYEQLNIQKKLKLNNLLPQLDIQYNFLNEAAENNVGWNSNNYKAGLRASFPLFLRKERGDLKLTKLKIQDNELEQSTAKVSLQNKWISLNQELISYETQNQITENIVNDYTNLLRSEERKFELGESSLFLVNTRESKLIEAELKAIQVQNKFVNVKATLFRIFNGTI